MLSRKNNRKKIRKNSSNKCKLITKKQKAAKIYKRTKKRNVLSGGGWRVNWGNVSEDLLSLLGWILLYGVLYITLSPLMLLLIAAHAPAPYSSERPTNNSKKPFIDLDRYFTYYSPRQTQLTLNENLQKNIDGYQHNIEYNKRRIEQALSNKKINNELLQSMEKLLTRFEVKKTELEKRVPFPHSQIQAINKNIAEQKIIIKQQEDQITMIEDEVNALVQLIEKEQKIIDKLLEERPVQLRGGSNYQYYLSQFESILRLLSKQQLKLNQSICMKIIAMFASSLFRKEKEKYITEVIYNLVESSGDDISQNKELITNFILEVTPYMKSNPPVYTSNEIDNIQKLSVEVKSDMSSSTLMNKMSQMFKLLTKSNRQTQTIRHERTIKTLRERKSIMQRLLKSLHLSQLFNIKSLFRPTKAQLKNAELLLDKVIESNKNLNKTVQQAYANGEVNAAAEDAASFP